MGNGVDRDTTALETKLERAADEMIKENRDTWRLRHAKNTKMKLPQSMMFKKKKKN